MPAHIAAIAAPRDAPAPLAPDRVPAPDLTRQLAVDSWRLHRRRPAVIAAVEPPEPDGKHARFGSDPGPRANCRD